MSALVYALVNRNELCLFLLTIYSSSQTENVTSHSFEVVILRPELLACGLTNCCPSVLDTVSWVIWPVKIIPDMTYNVFGGTLNPTLLSTLVD